MLGALGTLNALTLVYSRLPAVMADDGFLPRGLVKRTHRTNAPWVSILVCAAAWALCLGLNFSKLVMLDVLLTGLSILLEFAALVALRIREPELERPYRVPGGVGGAVAIGLPPLAAMFNGNGTAYAAQQEIPTRFVLWFNGNGITEKYWIPADTGPDYVPSPCLAPLAPLKQHFHVITGLDNPAARLPGPGNDHHRSMSALVSGSSFTGHGAGAASIDQLIAAKIGGDSRFR